MQKRNKLQTLPKPCEIFDLAGGTSTGGLVRQIHHFKKLTLICRLAG
jgi:patatin-like phospholipase/acyl hydrolase